MGRAFLETVIETLHGEGAAFVIKELGKQPAPKLTAKDAVYHGEFGRLCPDCDTPIGEKHLATCAFLRPLTVTYDSMKGRHTPTRKDN